MKMEMIGLTIFLYQILYRRIININATDLFYEPSSTNSPAYCSPLLYVGQYPNSQKLYLYHFVVVQ